MAAQTSGSSNKWQELLVLLCGRGATIGCCTQHTPGPCPDPPPPGPAAPCRGVAWPPAARSHRSGSPSSSRSLSRPARPQQTARRDAARRRSGCCVTSLVELELELKLRMGTSESNCQSSCVPKNYVRASEVWIGARSALLTLGIQRAHRVALERSSRAKKSETLRTEYLLPKYCISY